MILVSRPSNVPTPSPILTLDEHLVAFLQRPFEDNPAAGGGPPVTTLGPSDPETRDRLLAYAYVLYDTFVTRQLPPQSIPSSHASLLLPLLELLHGSHPYNTPIALLLGCVYNYHDLTQRGLQINGKILQYDPDNVSAMCNMGVNLYLMDLPVQAFQSWWKALQLSPINWDILDNMLETLLGSSDFNSTSPAVFDTPSTPHILQVRQQSLQVCNFVMGHLPGHRVKIEEVHRAQNTFRLRALLLRSLQEVGEWADLVEGIEIGINTTLAPLTSPTGSVRPQEASLDDLLPQVHCIGKSVCDIRNQGTSSGDDIPSPLVDLPSTLDQRQSFGVLQPSLEVPGWKTLQPTLFLFPEEVMRLSLMVWPSTDGSLPSVAISTVPENLRDDVRIELLKASTNFATSRLLRTWATRVQEFLGAQLSTGHDHTPVAVPCSTFQATQSPVVLASYLALSLHPTAVSYNDLGILLSSIDDQPRVSRSSGSSSTNEATGHNLSRLYFEAGLNADPRNAYLLANMGSYWKKERNYEEAIRYYQLALEQNPEFTAARVYLERTLKEIEPDFEGVRDIPTYQKFD